MLKFLIEGKGWWQSVQCLSMANVVNLECSLTAQQRSQSFKTKLVEQELLQQTAPHR